MTRRGRPEAVYALYHGDEYVDMGTFKELSAKGHGNVRSLQWMATASRYQDKIKNNPNLKRLIKVEDE